MKYSFLLYRFLFLPFFLFSFSLHLFSQKIEVDSGVRNDLRFAHYLISSDQYQDADWLLSQIGDSINLSPSIQDSLFFLKGWSAYYQKRLILSANALSHVSIKSPLYAKASFYAAYNYLYEGRSDSARKILDKTLADSVKLQELKQFEIAGVALIQRDYTKFDECRTTFTFSHFEFEKEERALNDIYLAHNSFNKKSPLAAGLFSAFIPGTGKMYVGKFGEGLSALFANSILAAITIENYRKGGLANYKTLAFGSLFSIFYIANIYGSIISVNVYRDEFYKSHDRQILFNLHIPLRNIFGQ